MFITPSFPYIPSKTRPVPYFSGKYDKPMTFVRAGHPEDKLTLGQTSKPAGNTSESGSFSRQKPVLQNSKSPILPGQRPGNQKGLGFQRSQNAAAYPTELETSSQQNPVERPKSPGVRNGLPLPGAKNVFYQYYVGGKQNKQHFHIVNPSTAQELKSLTGPQLEDRKRELARPFLRSEAKSSPPASRTPIAASSISNLSSLNRHQPAPELKTESKATDGRKRARTDESTTWLGTDLEGWYPSDDDDEKHPKRRR